MTDVTTIHQPVLLRDCVDLVVACIGESGVDRRGLHAWLGRAFHGIP